MKTIILSAAGAALLASAGLEGGAVAGVAVTAASVAALSATPAAAQSRAQQKAENRAERRFERRAAKRWRKGQRLDRARFNQARRIDYRTYRLRAPPRGYEWREVDGDFVLAALATGLILEAFAAAQY